MGQKQSTPNKEEIEEVQSELNISQISQRRELETNESEEEIFDTRSTLANSFASLEPSRIQRNIYQIREPFDNIIEKRPSSIFQTANTLVDLPSANTTPNKSPYRFVKMPEMMTPGRVEAQSDSQLWMSCFTEKKPSPFRLIVTEGNNDDSSVVTLSSHKLIELKIAKGSHAIIKGKKGHKLLRVVFEDKFLSDDKIGMNSVLRKNLRVQIGDIIMIKPYPNPGVLDSVHIAPIIDTLGPVHKSDIKNTYFKTYFEDKARPITNEETFLIRKLTNMIEFKVIVCEPMEFGIVGPNTVISLGKSISREEESHNDIGYDDIGGYQEQLAHIRELIELPIKQPRLVKATGMKEPRGVILYGPSGCGKKRISKAIAIEVGATYILIDGYDLASRNPSKAKTFLDEALKTARNESPSIVIVDRLELFFPSGTSDESDIGTRSISNISYFLDKLHTIEKTYCIGIVHEKKINPELKKFNIFNRAIFIDLPDEKARVEILKIHSKKSKLTNEEYQQISKETQGFTGEDLGKLAIEASTHCIREKLSLIDIDSEKLDSSVLDSLHVQVKHFRSALDLYKSTFLDIPNIIPETQSLMVCQKVEEVKRTPGKRSLDKEIITIEQQEDNFEPSTSKKNKLSAT